MRIIRLCVAVSLNLICLGDVYAGVYKCTGADGNTSYQSSPCDDQTKAHEVNVITGGLKDISQLEQEQEKAKQLEQEIQKKIAEEEKKLQEIKQQRLDNVIQQSSLNQQLIKNNPIQFSAFAIPPYDPKKLPERLLKFESRLAEIEKFRRLAALKALASTDCRRVVADELNMKSQLDQLVITVDCNNGKIFHFEEAELLSRKIN